MNPIELTGRPLLQDLRVIREDIAAETLRRIADFLLKNHHGFKTLEMETIKKLQNSQLRYLQYRTGIDAVYEHPLLIIESSRGNMTAQEVVLDVTDRSAERLLGSERVGSLIQRGIFRITILSISEQGWSAMQDLAANLKRRRCCTIL